MLRENLDMGRPDHVQLIFDRRVTRRTPTRHRTRVITDRVTPSLHVDYKHSRIKQYHKEGRALRTETVVNDTYDFDVGRRLRNLEDLKKVGFAANRRLLGVQRLSHDAMIGADVLDELHRPVCIDGQRAPALRFGDRRVQALFAALLRFDLLPQGFRNRELRETVAALCGLSLDDYGTGRMTYDLRRLRLRGLIERIPVSTLGLSGSWSRAETAFMPQKKYIVRLTDEEREICRKTVRKLKASSEKVRRAQILLKADADGPGWKDQQIADALSCRTKTVENVRQRCVQEGFERALERKRRPLPPGLKRLDGEQEAQVIALRLGTPPKGYASWSLRLLARRVVELAIVGSVSHETIRRTLKKTG